MIHESDIKFVWAVGVIITYLNKYSPFTWWFSGDSGSNNCILDNESIREFAWWFLENRVIIAYRTEKAKGFALFVLFL